jgi:hypothetical protein
MHTQKLSYQQPSIALTYQYPGRSYTRNLKQFSQFLASLRRCKRLCRGWQRRSPFILAIRISRSVITIDSCKLRYQTLYSYPFATEATEIGFDDDGWLRRGCAGWTGSSQGEWGPIETRPDFVSCVQGEDDVGDPNAMLRLEMWSQVYRKT